MWSHGWHAHWHANIPYWSVWILFLALTPKFQLPANAAPMPTMGNLTEFPALTFSQTQSHPLRALGQ